jgi:outer membrane protein
MKKTPFFNVLMLAVAMSSWPGAASAASLLEVYQQALQSDPLIHEAESRRLAALEASPQARSVLLPQINASGAYEASEDSGSRVQFDGVSFVPIESESEADTKSWNVELRQTLFRWDQWVGLRQADKRVAQAEVNYELAQQDLIVRVVSRYFQVLGAEDRLTSIHADRLAIARQLEQAKQRFDVGLIAITDVQESQAAYDQAVAREIASKRELATARELLREITGEYVPALSAPGEDFPLTPPSPSDQASWVDMALAQNLSLVSSRFDEKIARDEIAFRRTGHYPTLDLIASSQHSKSDSERNVAGGPFNPADSDFDSDSIRLQLTLPIFAGGGTSSRVREAVYLHRASQEQLQRVARETERGARDAYLGVLSEISRVQALEQAVESSRTALEATQAGFDVGTRTIVDVLDSQFALYVAITNYYQSRYDYIGNALLLKQSAGSLRIQDLEEIDRWLTERKPPEEVIAEEEAAGN